MPGFIAHIGKQPYNFGQEERAHLVVESTRGIGYQVERRVVNKFMNDRIFSDTADVLLVLDGVVLNNHELMAQYRASSWLDCVLTMYHQFGDVFFNGFRGSFSGLLYDKLKDKWIVFVDHIGDKQVLYRQTDDGYLIGSEMGFMVDVSKLNRQPLTLDRDSEYMALSISYTLEDKTLLSEIHKIIPGHYLEITKDGCREIQYHRFTNKPNENMTLEEAIEGVDKLFRRAVRMEFEKDREYGYKHIACLSGGLDSRMTVWVGHELGYTNQLNITFSQSNYTDFTVAQQIATDLGHDFLFKALDGGNCIFDIDDVTRINYGSACFFGTSHEYSMIRKLNLSEYGMVHTGQLGDVIVGSWQRRMCYGDRPILSDGAYSTTIIERIAHYQWKYDYEDVEIYKLYNRGFGGTAQGILGEQEFTEVISPFCDVDFLEFCYSVPVFWRYNHKLYFDWILQKYPKAAEYVWEKIGGKIVPRDNTPIAPIVHHYYQFFGHHVPVLTDSDFKPYIRRKFRRLLGKKPNVNKPTTETTMILNTNQNMNPVDYWYNTNPRLKKFMDSYWFDNKDLIEDDDLLMDMTQLYEKGHSTYDKLHTLSLLAAVKLIRQNLL